MCLNARGGIGRIDAESETFIPVCVPLLEVGARTGVSSTDPRAGSGIGENGDPMFTLQAGKQHGLVLVDGKYVGVRRLTPTECERLQGFPDGHTLVDNAADSPRYKALGNSRAVPVIRRIGLRILKALAH